MEPLGLVDGGPTPWVYGTDGADSMVGTAGVDYLNGGAGNDTLRGLAGNDVLNGGTGDNVIDGGDGDDFFIPDLGNDTIVGGDGNDLIVDSYGHNVIDGGTGDDTFTVFFESPAASSVVTGGSGSDTYEVSPSYSARDYVVTDFTAGAGGDRIDISNVLQQGIAYYGYSGGNPFSQGYLRIAQSGADALLQWDPNGPAGGAQWLALMTFTNVTAAAITGANFVGGLSPDGSPAPGDSLVGTESFDLLEGGFFDDTLRGLAGDDALEGNGGDDLLDGGDGIDWLWGSYGNDTLLGGAGNDSLEADEGDNVVDGGEGNDLIQFGPTVGVHDPLISSSGVTTATGGPGVDRFELIHLSADGMHVIADFTVGAGGDVLDFDELLDASTRYDAYSSGNPFSNANGVLRLVQSGSDTVLQWDVDGAAGVGFAWRDVIKLLGVSPSSLVPANFSLQVPGDGSEAPPLNLVGTAGPDTLLGATGNDTILGAGGNDDLEGNAGNDSLDGGDGNDWMLGGVGNDSLVGGAGRDDLDGDAGNDTLRGGAGNDWLADGFGVDVFDGGDGDDTINTAFFLQSSVPGAVATGGAGRDMYVLSPYDVPGEFRVTDFAGGPGGDLVGVDGALLASTEYGYFTGQDPFEAGFLRVQQSGPDVLVQYDADGAAGPLGWTTRLTLEGILASSVGPANFAGQYVRGTPGNDSLVGSAVGDTLVGLQGDDTLDGLAGGDTMRGGSGNDVYHVDDANDVVQEYEEVGEGDTGVGGVSQQVSIGHGIDEVESEITHTLEDNVELLRLLANSAIDGTGNSLDNVLVGNPATNHLSALSGNDTLTGGGGADTIDGGSGVDTIVFDGALSLVSGYSHSGGDWQVQFNGSAVHFTAIERVQFDGLLVALDTQPGDSCWEAAALLWAYYGSEPDSTSLGRWTAAADSGESAVDLAGQMLAAFGAPSAEALVQDLFVSLAHRAASPGEVALFTSQVGPGLPYASEADLLVFAAHHALNTGRMVGFTGGVAMLDAAEFG